MADLQRAVEEAYAAGLLGKNILGAGFDLDIVVHRGAGAYICGEETGLISSLEGKKGWPKIKPPFPAIKGAFGQPTIVNNVETLAACPHIITRGAEWFAGLGTKTQGGTRLYSVSGHVEQPGRRTRRRWRSPCASSSRPLRAASANGRRLKAVVPGGSSAPILTADEIDVTMDVDGLKNAGTMLGSAGVIVMDDTTCIPRGAHGGRALLRPRVVRAVHAVPRVHRLDLQDRRPDPRQGRARKEDPDTILDVAKRGAGNTICAFYDGAVGPYISYIEKFRAEFEHHVRRRLRRPGERGGATERMPKLTIDGKEIEVAAGHEPHRGRAAGSGSRCPTTAITPGSPSPGKCRLCMVDIEKVPRPRSPATRRRPTAWWCTPRRRACSSAGAR